MRRPRSVVPGPSRDDLRPCTHPTPWRRVPQMRRAGRYLRGFTVLLVFLGASVSLAEAQETTTTTTTSTTTTQPPTPPLFFDDLTIRKQVVGAPDAGRIFTVSFWCVPGIGPGGAVLPGAVIFDEQGQPRSNNMPGWLKGGAADCLLSETVAQDPRTGTILRGDDGGATSVSLHVRNRPRTRSPRWRTSFVRLPHTRPLRRALHRSRELRRRHRGEHVHATPRDHRAGLHRLSVRSSGWSSH